jgi:hypothetical protein
MPTEAMTAPALRPWKLYIDALREPDRSVFLHELRMLLAALKVPVAIVDGSR